MADLIDRQAAIKVMTSVLWHLPNERYRNLNEYEFSKGLAELGLNSAPSTQPEPKWIPCSERLPEEYGNYITTMNYGDVQECTYSPEKNTRFMRGGWSTCEHDGILFLDASEVIAWMPLPDPWKEGEQNEQTD